MAKAEIRAGEVDLPPSFEPWIGSEHAQLLKDVERGQTATGVRWHVLGESHYCRPDDPDAYRNHAGLTKEVVRGWALQPSRGSAFFTRVASIIMNRPAGEFDRPAAWEKFAYSNFVQELLSGPRKAPNAAQWADARRKFFGQLAITRPIVLIVLGSRLWQQLPWEVGARVPRMEFKREWGPVDDAWLYPYWVGDEFECALAVNVVHPSAGFGNWNWQTAAHRARTAMLFYSNVLESFAERYGGVGDRPFWLP
jgi:hypothetical protein